jgi:hypothetical protein
MVALAGIDQILTIGGAATIAPPWRRISAKGTRTLQNMGWLVADGRKPEKINHVSWAPVNRNVVTG